MRTKITILPLLLLTFLLHSCYTELWVEEPAPVADVPVSARQVLEAYDLWYVDIHATRGSGEVPFLQHAFTVSFDRGALLANNNLVGIGKTGNGLGIQVGWYDTAGGIVAIDHDIDGLWDLDVYVLGNARVELYDPQTDTSYFLHGYQRGQFDYDGLFYDNIHYFLQEYSAWEKTFASDAGALNDFDREHFLSFPALGNRDEFRSSEDLPGTPIQALVWDYQGRYTVYNVPGDPSLKTLTLDYEFMGNDYFELYVIDDGTIELYHPDSGTLYEFSGRGYRQFLKDAGTDLRKRRAETLPDMHVSRKRPG
ncbi:MULTISPECIES: nicotinic acid mononucleotide adenyltransferase [unclassified Robiginitalea]|uniref:nicotinic acid mononucleotide adenyltransferase n=1 Tax=Robiginitalea TaxID=252306 RepID=UPI00234B885C|nr:MULTISPECIES: nicotinic acid mononucleotide adenyltransferase [unclassified Robiginitalea]MDC6353020.1 nicotinic acid mononucleotide adenyltransferase [Robiginitalea sp. PM2]MDC6373813.1 nicotinic acid mononucleotide adenyltransferase [Robiginitalea sp. SP8]